MLTMDELDLLDWAVGVCRWAEETKEAARRNFTHITEVRDGDIAAPPQRAFGPEGSDELAELVRRLRAEDASAYLQEVRRG